MHRHILSLLLLIAPVAAAQAEEILYLCKFNPGRQQGGGWVSEDVRLLHDTVKGTIIVNDPVIQEFVGQPIGARIADRTAVRTTFAWEVTVKDPKKQSFRMTYRLSHFSNGRPARLTAQPGGFDNSWSGEGSCRLQRG